MTIETPASEGGGTPEKRAVPRATRLLNRNFLLLWQGQAVSQLGTQVYAIAVVFVVKHATESASLIGLLMMISSIPGLLLGPAAGAIADTCSRRRIIIVADLFRGIVVSGLAVLLYQQPEATDLIIMALGATAVCMSICGAFFGPAIAAAIPDLVPEERVIQANSLRQFTSQLAMFVGRGLGGVLFRLLGAPLLVLVNGLSFLFSAAMMCLIEIPHQTREGPSKGRLRSFVRSIGEGLYYVWKRPGLRSLFLFSAMFNFFTMPIVVVLPFYVEDYLGLTPDWYGYLLAIFGAGALVGSLSAGILRPTGRLRAAVVMLFAIVNSCVIVSLAYTFDARTALGLAFVIGALAAFNGTNVFTIVQISTPSEIRGRTTALLNTLSGSAAPLGMGLAGVVFDASGRNIPLLFGSCGAALVVLSVLVSMNANFRKFLAYR